MLIISCSSSKLSDKLNGGFENYDLTDRDLDGWTTNNLPQTKKYADLSIDKSVVHSGHNSVYISISKDHPQINTVYNWVRRVNGLEGRENELSGWLKTKEIKISPYFEVECWNEKEDKMIGNASTKKTFSISGTKNWQRAKIIFQIPKGTTKIFIKAGIQSSENEGGKVWFDDLQLKRVKN